MSAETRHPSPYAVRCTGDTLDGPGRFPCGIVYL
ncbi:hypothetical protein LCGC14_2026180, partial [marine sediment metagenome]